MVPTSQRSATLLHWQHWQRAMVEQRPRSTLHHLVWHTQARDSRDPNFTLGVQSGHGCAY